MIESATISTPGCVTPFETPNEDSLLIVTGLVDRAFGLQAH